MTDGYPSPDQQPHIENGGQANAQTAPAAFVQRKATMLGRVAKQSLTGNPTVVVAGVTSRGVFLRLDERWIVFLSGEAYHGPLTMNVSGDPAPLLRLVAGEPAMVADGGVVFPAHDLEVLAADALVWQAPAPPRDRLPAGRIRARLRETIEQIYSRESDPSLAPGMLLELRRLLAHLPAADETPGPFLSTLKRLSRALRDGQPRAVEAALQECLGLGPGLTPSGDDLTLGFLLALERWGRDLGVNLDAGAVRAAVVTAAQRQTTLLAANLIACAVDGQADERLITALDGLVTGAPDAATCAAYLCSWGSSSGIDALAGMASVLLAAPDQP